MLSVAPALNGIRQLQQPAGLLVKGCCIAVAKWRIAILQAGRSPLALDAWAGELGSADTTAVAGQVKQAGRQTGLPWLTKAGRQADTKSTADEARTLTAEQHRQL